MTRNMSLIGQGIAAGLCFSNSVILGIFLTVVAIFFAYSAAHDAKQMARYR